MCSVYGHCPPPTTAEPPPLPPLQELSASAVSGLVDSLRPEGSRDSCPAGCTLLALFNGTAYQQRGINGPRLARILRQHERGLPKSQQHNETARRLHGEWLASLGVIPPQADLDQRLGYATRLKDSVLLATGFTAAPAGNKSKRRSLQARSSAGRGSA